MRSPFKTVIALFSFDLLLDLLYEYIFLVLNRKIRSILL